MQEDKNVKSKGFWKGMKAELKKVIWPTGEQTVKSTFATIAFVLLISIILIVFNLFFDLISGLWINGLSHNKDVIQNVVISGDQSTNADHSEVIEELSGEVVVDENVEEASGEETSSEE